ncbi:MAG: hypothetical protein AAF193_07580 [Bacteroidota bacterium]
MLGFVQERFKVALNYYLDVSSTVPGFYDLSEEDKILKMEEARLDVPYDYYYNHSSFNFFHWLSFRGLVILKWLATGGFIFLNGYFGWLVLRHLPWPDCKSFYFWLHISVLVLALTIYIGSVLFGYRDVGYGASRKLIGFLQSPTPAIIVWFCYLGVKRFRPDELT